MASGHSHRRYASIIIVPPHREQTINFNVPSWVYHVLVGGIGALVAMVVGGILLTAWMGVQLRHLRGVEARNVALAAEAARVTELEREIDEIEDFKLRVLQLAGADVSAEIEARAAARADVVQPADPAEAAPPEPAGPDIQAEGSGALGTMPSLWPVEGVVSKGFRVDGEPATLHHGIDIAASFRSAVRAAGAGSVVFAGRDSIFGQLVVIDHGKQVQSYYGHNSSLEVGSGDRVRRGQTIAKVGSTGESSAPHLHFEVRKNGKPIDPRTYLVD